MPINYTIKSVAKDNIVVTYEDNREVTIPVATYVNKDWIEAQIRNRFNEADEGTVDDIAVKVGDTGSVPTFQENEASIKKSNDEHKAAFDSATFDYKLIRSKLYPWQGDQLGALVKAVITGDKTELEAINTAIEKVKTDYPKDSKAYTQTELAEIRTKNPAKDHFPPYSQPGLLPNG